MKRFILALSVFVLVHGAHATSTQNNTFTARLDSNFFDANRIFSWMDPTGSVISYKVTGYAGMHWPYRDGGSVGFCSALGLVGKVNGEIRAAWGEYTTEFLPGPILDHSNDVEPYPARIFKINRNGTGDWGNWPWHHGAPVVKTKAGKDSLDENGRRIPRLLGDQTLWMVINDADERQHWLSAPLNIEMHITVWGYNDVPPWSDMMFVKWKIINKNETATEDAYITLFLDYDIGNASNNRAACDTTLSLGYGYAETLDEVFSPAPPGFGFVLLQGPLVPAPGESGSMFGEKRQNFKNLPMTSFIGSG